MSQISRLRSVGFSAEYVMWSGGKVDVRVGI